MIVDRSGTPTARLLRRGRGRSSAGSRCLLAHEGEAPAPSIVEPFEPELPAAGVFPEGERVAAAEEAEPRVVEECHRMAERAAYLVDEVLPRVPVRQWVLTLPCRLRYRLAWVSTVAQAELPRVTHREPVR